MTAPELGIAVGQTYRCEFFGSLLTISAIRKSGKVTVIDWIDAEGRLKRVEPLDANFHRFKFKV